MLFAIEKKRSSQKSYVCPFKPAASLLPHQTTSIALVEGRNLPIVWSEGGSLPLPQGMVAYFFRYGRLFFYES